MKKWGWVVALAGVGVAATSAWQLGVLPLATGTPASGHAGHMTPADQTVTMKTPTVAAAPDGRLWRAWVEGEHVWVSVSGDRGTTFSPPVRVNPDPEEVDANGESRPKIVLGPRGEIYVTYTWLGKKLYTGDIRFSRSLDGGRTFEPPRTVNDDGLATGHRFDALAVAPDGTIYVAWIDKRDLERALAANTPYDGAALYYTVSRDGGTSFLPNRKVKDFTCECCRIAHAFDAEGRLVLLWRDLMTGSIRDHAMVRLSADGAAGPVTRVTADDWELNACPHHGPSLSMGEAQSMHIVWFTGESPRGPGAFYGRLDAAGRLETAPRRLGPAEPSTGHGVVHADGSHVTVIWKEGRKGGGSTVRVIESPDNGLTFTDPRELAATAGPSDHPFLVDTPEGLLLSWFSAREGHRLLPVWSAATTTD
jgi:hypothetical protein